MKDTATLTLDRLPRFEQKDYRPKAPRIAGVKRTYPSKRGWGPGWPNAQTGRLERISANRINGVRVFKEVAELVTYLLKASNALGYDIRKASERDGYIGSFANRPIKHSNPKKPSWHSWGLAIDQNAKSNPMLKVFQSTTPPDIVYLWESAGFFWGGRYPVPPWYFDAMHFEYLFSPQDVAGDLKNAQNAFGALGGKTLYPTQSMGATSSAAMVRVLQYRLNEHGADLSEDGDFGPLTNRAIRRFQRDNDLVVDGIVGPITWAALNEDSIGEDAEMDEDE